jgi:tellurite resistance protein TerC
LELAIDCLTAIWLGIPLWAWCGFILFVVGLLALDLGLFHREAHEVDLAESLKMAAFYVAIAVAFGAVVWWLYYTHPPTHSLDPAVKYAASASGRAWTALQLYYTGYIVEYTLAIDNVFVIGLVFTYFAVPRAYQHRVLFWGILGVIVLRGIMIGLGAVLVSEFYWVLYLFAVFLIFTGVKMLMPADGEKSIGDNPAVRFMRRHLRVTDTFHGSKFFVKLPDAKTGKVASYATPLFLALVTVEIVDVVFAVDSVPAIFAITQEPFIVFTSNIFAIIGLRTLYFTLAAMVHRFHYLKYALALVLIFIGMKIFLGDFVFSGKVPAALSLSITLGLILGGILYSLWKTRGEISESIVTLKE